MKTYYTNKATNEEIRNRFDQDVERFSNLDTGQKTIIDAPLMLELCTEAAMYVNPQAKELLDVGCGAGNLTLRMLSRIPGLNCTLNDLSLPMLERAKVRVSGQTTGQITLIQQDMRDLELPSDQFDIVLASATLHHLRDDADWENMFQKFYRILKPGGSIWISDIVTQEAPVLERMFQKRFSDHLESIGGPQYRDHVLEYVDYEDTPRSLNYQLELLRKTGFSYTEILHKNSNVAAFGAIK